ncbi:sulfide:quinone oxidoreductase, mitochondrial isoform X2 [Anabrus simplex]
MFTLIGGGIKKLQDSRKPMSSVLPKNALWLKDEVMAFEPASNSVQTKKGDHIKYDFMVVAIGIQLLYDAIPGLLEGLKMSNSGICSNYSPLYVNKTFETLKTVHEGNAVFTFPNTPVKCAGAPQKILYIADDYLRKKRKRNDVKLIYNTSLPNIFSVKKYADALWKVIEERDIKVNLRTNLIEIRPDKKEAVFQNLDEPEVKTTQEYSMLHVCPPQGAPDVLKTNKDLSDATGFLEINKNTLQHLRFPNVFGIGDCTNLPTSKTAAAAAAQCGVLRESLSAALAGRDVPDVKYNGYTSCPLVTGYGRCILAEFDYNLQPMETFPVDQGVERYSMYAMKAYAMPHVYWHLLLNGYWEGPKNIRKMLHFGMCR